MMLLQHAALEIFYSGKEFNKNLDNLEYKLLPDTIRFYTKNREYSHFELSQDGKSIAYIKFPESLSDLDKNFNKIEKWMDNNNSPAAIGCQTVIEKFNETNKHLHTNKFCAISKHLVEDYYFDIFIRTYFNCSLKNEDIYFDQNNNMLNGTKLREAINKIENIGYLIIARLCYNEYGLTIDQKFIDEFLKPKLNEYCIDMKYNSLKYMQLDVEIDYMITKHDFSSLSEYDYIEDLEFIYKNLKEHFEHYKKYIK